MSATASTSYPTGPSYPGHPLPTYTVVTSQTPHKCPVCQGKGTVPEDFYEEPAWSPLPGQCRSCYGGGVIWR